MTDTNIHVQSRWGASADAPTEQQLADIVAELYREEDPEHAGAWMVRRDTLWTLRLDEDRSAYLERDEDDAVSHLPGVTPQMALELWPRFAEGGLEAVAGFPWRPGPRL